MKPTIKELRDGTVRVSCGLDQQTRFHTLPQAERFRDLLVRTQELRAEVNTFVRLHGIAEDRS